MHVTYKSAREPAIRSMLEAACALAGRKSNLVKVGDHIQIIPDVPGHAGIPVVDVAKAEIPQEGGPAHLTAPEHPHPG